MSVDEKGRPRISENRRMTRSRKLGIASIVLGVGSFTLQLLRWTANLPIGLVLAFISCLLGLFATQRGSKWWLVVPVILLLVFAALFYVGFHAV